MSLVLKVKKSLHPNTQHMFRQLTDKSSFLTADRARKLCTAGGWNRMEHGEWTDYQPCEKTTSILTIEYLRCIFLFLRQYSSLYFFKLNYSTCTMYMQILKSLFKNICKLNFCRHTFYLRTGGFFLTSFFLTYIFLT